MSYDIRFGVKVAQHENVFAYIGEPELSSPTWNNGKIFRKSMGWEFKTDTWYKLIDVIPNIEQGIHELQFNSEAYVDLEPKNGWGGIKSSLNSLQSIMQWITEELPMGWNSTIPKDCIYIHW